MPGEEAVQVRLTTDGKAEARNVYAPPETDDVVAFGTQALTNVSGKKDGAILTVSFTKAWDGAQNGSIPFVAGTPLSIHVAKNVDNADWTKKHTVEGAYKEKIDIFSWVPPTAAPVTTTAAGTTKAPVGNSTTSAAATVAVAGVGALAGLMALIF